MTARRSARIRRFLNWLVRLRGSPRAIAGGVAIGMLVAFTPTIGFQTVLALALATLLGANRPVSIVPTWITSPVTAAPIYAFTYSIGNVLWRGPDVATVARALEGASRELETLDFLALRRQLEVFLQLGIDVFVPLMIGGLVVGGVAAAISYPLTLRLVVRLRTRRERRQKRVRSSRLELRDRGGREAQGQEEPAHVGDGREHRARRQRRIEAQAPDQERN